MRLRYAPMLMVLLFSLLLFLMQCETAPRPSDISSAPQRALAAAPLTVDKSGYAYDPNDRSCDGFPRVKVATLPGTCLGMVLPRDFAVDAKTKATFIMPRTIVQLANSNDFLVVDMGGWKENNGSLFWLKPKRRASSAADAYSVERLKFPLNTPHGLAQGPDGFIYIGENEKISRFHFVNGNVFDWQTVIADLPSFKGHMHPLTQFTFDANSGDLYINSGAPSDHCYVKETGQYRMCPEEFADGMGSIYRVPSEMLRNIPEGGIKNYEIAASGLRNSMAMAVHSSGTLLQGENSRDFPERDEPYEEINVIDPKEGSFQYGWPYCYDYHATSPEWLFKENAAAPLRFRFVRAVDCGVLEEEPGGYRPPWALMPPHVAPLHMAYYDGAMFRDLLGGQLLVSWHGYQPTGHRLVSYAVDERGRPKLAASTAKATYGFNQNGGCPRKLEFKPHGGMKRHAPYTEVISGWNEIKGIRPKGAPVGFTVAKDGSIWIVEDKNRVILRLARTTDTSPPESCGEQQGGKVIDPSIRLLAWRHAIKGNARLDASFKEIQVNLLQKYCTGCHGNFQEEEIRLDRFSQLDFLTKNDWLVPGKPEQSRIFQATSQSGEIPAMPPADKEQFFGTPTGDALLNSLAEWIRALPTDVDARYSRVVLPDSRRIRARPSSEDPQVCGQFQAGDTVYVDARNGAEVKSSGWIWNKVYLVPSHTRLFINKCAYPEDGVFYVAVRKM